MKPPAFQFYYDRFMSSTFLWTNEQVGAYMRLLCIQANQGYVEKHQIDQITHDIHVKNKFVEIEKGKFANEILSEVIADREAYSKSRSINRLGKKKKKDMKNISYSHEKDMVEVDVDIEVEEDKGKRGMGKKPILDLIPTSWPKDEFLAGWAEFVEVRKKLKKPLTDAAIKRAINKLISISGADWPTAKLIIDQSVDKSYDSFYPLKGTNGQASFNHPVTGQAPPHGKGYDRQGRLWPLVGGRLIDEA